MSRIAARLPFLILLGGLAAGCASSAPLERINREQAATIQSLSQEVRKLNEQMNAFSDRASQTQAALTACHESGPETDAGGMEQMKSNLEQKLNDAVESGDLTVQMEDKGIVVTVLDRILFDPGQAALKPSALAALDQVAAVLQGEAANNMIYIEGHTDNVPVRTSVWRSNWELSTARATEVVHYFAEQKGINPARLAATGYGEFRPAGNNETPEGRMKNRRVEIVISPKTME